MSELQFNAPTASTMPAPEQIGENLEKSRLFTPEDGLEEEIQRAIAQHDLAQQLQEKQDQQGDGQHEEPDRANGELEKPVSADENREIQTEADKAMEDAIKSGIDAAMAIDEKQQLHMIADELKRATSDTQEPPTDPELTNGQNLASSANESHENNSQTHPGYIPPDLELLATNSALAAYNALSSQVPSVASLGNVHLAAIPLPIVAPENFPPKIQLLVNTLPVLDNFATQLLRIYATGPYQKIFDLCDQPDSPAGHAFYDLKSYFDLTRKLYSEEVPFLSVEHLAPGMWKEGDKTPSMFRSREQTIESTLRKANLATFLTAMLGGLEIGFFYLNEFFLDVFCPANNLDPANSMSNMTPSNMNLQSGANTIVGDKVGKLLKPQALLYLELKTLTYTSGIAEGSRPQEEVLEDCFPSNLEQKLLDRRGVKTLTPTEADFVARCQSRKETLRNFPENMNLEEEYNYIAFLRELFDYVSKNMGFLIWGKKTKINVKAERAAVVHTPHSDEQLQPPVSAPENPVASVNDRSITDITSGLLPSEIQEQQIHIRINPRMQGKVTSRRPWTREEEKALRHALEMKGTQWSVILELFGQGGSINELLKNRTQVQLKDKARNWKMFFLKSGLPVPAYLQKVTGDLERDDKVRAKNARNRKAAAPPKKDDAEENERKKQRV